MIQCCVRSPLRLLCTACPCCSTSVSRFVPCGCQHLLSVLQLPCRSLNCWAHETYGALSVYLSCPDWCRYLDYVEAKGDVGMTVRMFERCLVACANYPGGLQPPSTCRAGPSARYCAQLPSYLCSVHLSAVCFQCKFGTLCILQPGVHAWGSRQNAMAITATACAGATRTASHPGLPGLQPPRLTSPSLHGCLQTFGHALCATRKTSTMWLPSWSWSAPPPCSASSVPRCTCLLASFTSAMVMCWRRGPASSWSLAAWPPLS